MRASGLIWDWTNLHFIHYIGDLSVYQVRIYSDEPEASNGEIWQKGDLTWLRLHKLAQACYHSPPPPQLAYVNSVIVLIRLYLCQGQALRVLLSARFCPLSYGSDQPIRWRPRQDMMHAFRDIGPISVPSLIFTGGRLSFVLSKKEKKMTPEKITLIFWLSMAFSKSIRLLQCPFRPITAGVLTSTVVHGGRGNSLVSFSLAQGWGRLEACQAVSLRRESVFMYMEGYQEWRSPAR